MVKGAARRSLLGPEYVPASARCRRRRSSPVASVAITSRAAFEAAPVVGMTASETEPKGKAATEIRALWRIIEKEVAHGGPRSVADYAALAQTAAPLPAAVAEPAAVLAAKPPKADDGNITISLKTPRDLLKELKSLAIDRRVRVNDVVLEAIVNHLALNGRKTAA